MTAKTKAFLDTGHLGERWLHKQGDSRILSLIYETQRARCEFILSFVALRRPLSSRERVFIFILSLEESGIYSEPPYLTCDIDVV